MRFHIAAEPGTPGKPNEDYAGALGSSAVLLDGSGAPGDMPSGCVHGVTWFVRQLGARCLERMETGDPGVPLPALLEGAITSVMDLHRDCDLSSPGTPSGMIVMTRARGKSFDWLVLGDSALVLDAEGKTGMIQDKRMDEVAPPEYQKVLSLPSGTPEHQAARVAFVRKQQPLRNAPGGYPVASTDPGAAHKALTGSVPVSDVRRAALISDGVTRYGEFGLGSWEDLLDVLTAGGPVQLLSRIREAEKTDPEGIRWPRAKAHDDTGIVFLEDIR